DIRSTGSGNIGATNVARLLGRKWGVIVFVLDFSKGAVAVLIARWLGDIEWLPVAAGGGGVPGDVVSPLGSVSGGERDCARGRRGFHAFAAAFPRRLIGLAGRADFHALCFAVVHSRRHHADRNSIPVGGGAFRATAAYTNVILPARHRFGLGPPRR